MLNGNMRRKNEAYHRHPERIEGAINMTPNRL